MDKLSAIEEFTSKPLEIGQKVRFWGEGNGSRNPQSRAVGEIAAILDDGAILVKKGQRKYEKPADKWEIYVDHIGANPFQERVRIDFHKTTMSQLLHYFKREQMWEGVETNPHIGDGAKTPYQYYQRAYCWSVKQKQDLIDTIYLGLDIGKFVFRWRSFQYLEAAPNRVQLDIVDGKQRAEAIVMFTRGAFADSYGNTWGDLSTEAQRRFMSYGNFVLGFLPEEATDEETLKTFLAINHLGVPQSEEHIEFVKSLLK